MGGVPREQKMLKGHLPRVMYHRAYFSLRRELAFAISHRLILDGASGVQHKQARALPVRGGDQRGHPRGRQDPGARKFRQVKPRLSCRDAQVSVLLYQNARLFKEVTLLVAGK